MLCTKNDVLGEIVRCRAQLIANGYSQVAEVNFNKIFVSMAKLIIIRCTIVLGVAMNWESHQMNVKMAYVNRILVVEIYIDKPEDFVQNGNKNLVYNSRKLC